MTADVPVLHANGMVDLAPEIYRQRLVVEGLVDAPISAQQIEEYLSELSDVLGMVTLLQPVTHQSDKYGWAGWIHWETSGAHFYGWDQPRLFFSVDIYTCKAFPARDAVDFTQRFFGASEVSFREF
jgi:S-adenosylmethionine decarboxylase